MAKHLNGKENIRLLSLGTGESASQNTSLNNKDSFTKVDSILSIANQDFVTTFESVAADKLMLDLLPSSTSEDFYFRANVNTDAQMDDANIE